MQHGRLHHPATLVVVEHGEQLVGEVAGDQLVVAAEGLDEAIGVVGALERQPGEHEPCGPTLGALAQVVEPLVVEPFGGGAQQGGGLDGVEPEVAGTDLADTPAHSHPTEPERRIGAGDQHERELRWAQVDEALHAPVHLGVIDEVVVVEHDDEPLGQRRQLVDERRDDHLAGAERTGHERFQSGGDLGVRAADRCSDRHPEAGRVGVGLLQLQPRHPRRWAAAHPATSVDLPEPAGALTSTSGTSAASASSNTAPRRVRSTSRAGGPGGRSLVAARLVFDRWSTGRT